MRALSGLALLVWILSGCVHAPPGIEARGATAKAIAETAGWEPVRIVTHNFVLAAYAPAVSGYSVDVLTIYVEGDGLAWLNVATVSSDPTPRNPLALRLAVQHPGGAAAWLARPCQYVTGEARRGCAEKWWTSHRFAEEVIAASNSAIDELKYRAHARQVALVGYSGGAAVAALVAARRTDVASLTTVAGNLDPALWTQWHALTPLSGSLNPVDVALSLSHVPQTHWVGGRDKVVGRRLADSFAARMPADTQPRISVLEEADHYCCWAERWLQILISPPPIVNAIALKGPTRRR